MNQDGNGFTIRAVHRFGVRGLLGRILGVAPNYLLNAKKLSNDRGNVRFALGGW
jgi:hypothetical protein